MKIRTIGSLICVLSLMTLLFVSCRSGNGGKVTTLSTTEKTTQAPKEGIVLDKSVMVLGIGDTDKLVAKLAEGGLETSSVLWSSSNPACATVDISGNVSGIADGIAVITAKTLVGDFTASCQVTVSSTVTGVSLDVGSLELHVGDSKVLVATVYPVSVKNNGVMWTSSVEECAVVSENGIITAKKNGSTTICAKTVDGNYTAFCTVNVTTPVKGISITDTIVKLNKGVTTTLSYTVSPIDASDKTVTWTTSNDKVAIVSDGKVTAVGAGDATITATTVNGHTANCIISVTAPVVGVALNYTAISMNVGKAQQLLAILNPTDATVQGVKWSSSDSAVASVESLTGVVSAVSSGTATITATTVDGLFTADCTVTVIRPVSSITFEKDVYELDKNNTVQLVTSFLPLNADPEIFTFTSSDNTVATVDESGIVTGLSHGSAVITVSSQYGVTGTCTVNVTDRELISVPVTGIDVASKALILYEGEKYVINATVTPENATNKLLTYKISNESYLGISNNEIIGISDGVASVTITAASGVTTVIYVQVKSLTEEQITQKISDYNASITAENERYDAEVKKLEQAYNDESDIYNSLLLGITVTEEEYNTLKAEYEAKIAEYEASKAEAVLNNNTELQAQYEGLIREEQDKLDALNTENETRLGIVSMLSSLREKHTENLAKEDALHKTNTDKIEYDYQFVKKYIAV